MPDELLNRLRARVDALEEETRDLRLLFADQNFEIRKDVHLTMSSIGIALYELQQATKQQTMLLNSIDNRIVRLETWAAAQDEMRIERQGAVDAKLEALRTDLRRRWWWFWR